MEAANAREICIRLGARVDQSQFSESSRFWFAFIYTETNVQQNFATKSE